jgi:hypothetical protein
MKRAEATWLPSELSTTGETCSRWRARPDGAARHPYLRKVAQRLRERASRSVARLTGWKPVPLLGSRFAASGGGDAAVFGKVGKKVALGLFMGYSQGVLSSQVIMLEQVGSQIKKLFDLFTWTVDVRGSVGE